MENKEFVLSVMNKNEKILFDLKLEIYPNIPQKMIRNAHKSHSLGLHEDILLMKDNTIFMNAGDESMILTEHGISLVLDNKKSAEKITWKDIKKVEFDSISNRFLIQQKSKQKRTEIERDKMVKETSKSNSLSLKFSEILTEISTLFHAKEIIKEIKGKHFANEFNDVIKLIEENEKVFINHFNTEVAILKSNAYAELRLFDNAFQLIDKIIASTTNEITKFNETIQSEIKKNNSDLLDDATSVTKIKIIEEVKKYNSSAYETKAKIYELQFDTLNALTFYSLAQEHATDKEIFSKKIKELYNSIKKIFNEIPKSKREYILISKDKIDFSADNILALPSDNLPLIEFPKEHPKNMGLYVAHPIKSGIYKPIEKYQIALIDEQKNEFSMFLACLGATKIIFEEKFISKNIEKTEKSNSVNGVVGLPGGLHNIEGGYSNSENKDSFSKDFSKANNTLEYKPTKPPYLAENLSWYDDTWKFIYTQRMDGNLLRYEKTLKTNSSNLSTNSGAKNFKAQYDGLYGKLGFSLDTKIDISSLKEESKGIHVMVEFAPLHELIKVEEPIEEIKQVEEKPKEVVEEKKVEEKPIIIIPAPKNFFSKFLHLFLNIFRSK